MARYRSKREKSKRAMRDKPLSTQLNERLKEKFCPGYSKHADKKEGVNHLWIYSYSSFENYQKHGNIFLKWVKEHYPEAKKLDDCLQYGQEFLDDCATRLSPATVKVYASAICKIYGLTGKLGGKAYFNTPQKSRREITRSRKEVISDKYFSEKKNADFVEFCRSCGPRRNDVKTLLVSDIDINDMTITFRDSKGGKTRISPYIGDKKLLLSLIKGKSPNDLVFDKIHSKADIHSFRADYAARLYQLHARPLVALTRQETYYGRGDRKGVRLDKRAMLIVSRALGHNRINVMADHYLYNL